MKKRIMCSAVALVMLMGLALAAYGSDEEKKDKKDKTCAPPTVDVTGTWITKTFYIHDCEGHYPDTLPPIPVIMEQSGNAVTVSSPVLNMTAKICGNTITWRGSYPDSGGTSIVDNFRVDISADGKSLVGRDDWHWMIGTYTCTGSDWFIGTKQQ